MIINKTKNYLFSVKELFLSNDLFLSLFFLIEFFPIFYNTLDCSFKLSTHQYPAHLMDYLSYLSFYDKIFEDAFDKKYPGYILYISIVFPILYGAYKYFLLSIKWFKENIPLKKFAITFSEIFIFRIIVILLFDLSINKMLFGNKYEIVFGMFFFLFYYF